ncbi:MAG: alpha-E domain-containing protein [Candidatus Phaeomarinobacter sp.]
MARYLWLTLADGVVLSGRDDVLYLKTLDGLKRVDLVLRRVDSEFCDPLELRTESELGVAGLVRAVRAGNVVVANALGTGILETQALHAYMPAIAKHYDDGDLLLPDIATWWCGDPKARDHVIANLDSLAITEAASRHRVMAPAVHGTAGSDIGPTAREQLIRSMRLRGGDFVAQEMVTLSSTPILDGSALAARPVSLRCYVASVGDDYIVMPGGMARFSADTEPRALSMQSGDGSKDVWVIGDGPPDDFSMMKPAERASQTRSTTGDLPSRAADNLFWLGRYIERTDATLRLGRACVMRLAEPEAYPGGGAALSRLALLLHARADDATAPDGLHGPVDVLLARLNLLLTDPSHLNSIPSAIDNVQRTAYLVRDRLSMDSLRNITEFAPALAPLSGASTFETSPTLAMVQENLTITAALAGQQAENTTRGAGWLFVEMGKRIERAQNLISVLRTLVIDGDAEANGSLALILELADSFMTYRTRYVAAPQLAPMLDLVVLDETNPRSVAFQVVALSQAVGRIPRPGRNVDPTEDELSIAALEADIRMVELDALCDRSKGGRLDELDAMLARLNDGLSDLSNTISRIYFAHAESQRISFAPRH